MSNIIYPEDWHIHKATERHPVCCFFEAFPSSPDPNENFYGAPVCHMVDKGGPAEICKGDYLECPLKDCLADLRAALERCVKLLRKWEAHLEVSDPTLERDKVIKAIRQARAALAATEAGE